LRFCFFVKILYVSPKNHDLFIDRDGLGGDFLRKIFV
jgi:hypothetical protein